MPYMLRLTNSGIAMHFGNVSRRATSHGCIRMEKTLSKKMFKWAKIGRRCPSLVDSPAVLRCPLE